VPLAVIGNGRQRRRRRQPLTAMVSSVDTINDTSLVRHVVVTVLLAATALVVAWQVLFADPDMGASRYTPGRADSTGNGGTAVQTGPALTTKVMSEYRHPLPPGVPHAK
jgi:hypothetical protein